MILRLSYLRGYGNCPLSQLGTTPGTRITPQILLRRRILKERRYGADARLRHCIARKRLAGERVLNHAREHSAAQGGGWHRRVIERAQWNALGEPGAKHECPVLHNGSAQIDLPFVFQVGRPLRSEKVSRHKTRTEELVIGHAVEVVLPSLG